MSVQPDPRRYLRAEDITWLESMGWEMPYELRPVPAVYRHAAKRMGVTPREAWRIARERSHER